MQTASTGESVSSALTAREREVLQLLAEGKTTKEISSHLNVSERTVDAHRQHIMSKLNIHSIAELTKYAIRQGLHRLNEFLRVDSFRWVKFFFCDFPLAHRRSEYGREGGQGKVFHLPWIYIRILYKGRKKPSPCYPAD